MPLGQHLKTLLKGTAETKVQRLHVPSLLSPPLHRYKTIAAVPQMTISVAK